MDTGFRLGSHKIGVVLPTGHNVDMEVGGKSGSCGPALIDSDVKAMRMKSRFEKADNPIDGAPQIRRFVIRKQADISNFTVGRNQRMAGIVRVAVQNSEDGFGAEEDKMRGIFA